MSWLYAVVYVSFAIGAIYLSVLSYWFVADFVKHFITEWVETDAAEA